MPEQMTDEQIVAAIDAQPRLAHVTAAARRDPTTIERTPGVDPRHIDEARRMRAERDEFLATAPSAFTGRILGPMLDALAED